jgi:hypothetical protein
MLLRWQVLAHRVRDTTVFGAPDGAWSHALRVVHTMLHTVHT